MNKSAVIKSRVYHRVESLNGDNSSASSCFSSEDFEDESVKDKRNHRIASNFLTRTIQIRHHQRGNILRKESMKIIERKNCLYHFDINEATDYLRSNIIPCTKYHYSLDDSV
jgi:hypothetical protein